MDRILQEPAIKLPRYIENGLKEESIASYNMGIFGGSDMKFIGDFCKEAMTLCETNKNNCLNGNFTILFEQILFAYKVRKENQSVGTIFHKIFNDNGYTIADICDLRRYDEKRFFHLLGGHKRNQEVIDSLTGTILVQYPDYYKRIIFLFPNFHPRGLVKGSICIPLMFSDNPIKSYIEFLNNTEKEWCAISWEDLLEVEIKCARGKGLSYHKDNLNDINVCYNPYIKCFDVPTTWATESLQKMRQRLSQNKDVPIQRIAIIPSISSKLRKEYVLFELESQVLEVLREHPMRISELLNKLTSRGGKEMYSLWLTEIQILLNEGLIIPIN